MKKLGKMALVLAIAVTAAGCGVPGGVGPDQSREDAQDTQNVDKSPPAVIAFNNHYPNVQHKCDGFGHRVFVTSNGSADTPRQPQVLVVADPACDGYESETGAAASGVQVGAAG